MWTVFQVMVRVASTDNKCSSICFFGGAGLLLNSWVGDNVVVSIRLGSKEY
jgi:hypothetical protein